MPSVSVLPNSPVNRNFASSNPSGSVPVSTVQEIKDNVKLNVHQKARGASALSLLNAARERAISGTRREEDGDLPGALTELLTAAKLIQLFLETAEFKSESQGRKGAVWKEFVEFQQDYGNDLIPRASKVEAKLTDFESQKAARAAKRESSVSVNSAVSTASGGSVADRVRLLQGAGLSVSTKRSSRDLSSSAAAISHALSSTNSQPQSPHLPGSATSAHSNSFAQASSSLDPPSPAPSSSFPSPSSPAVSILPQSHSQSSATTTPSPRINHFPSVSEFASHFPSIDELDEREFGSSVLPSLPSVPTTVPGSSVPIVRRLPQPPVSPTTSVMTRFPSIHLDNPQRPASTPIPAVNGMSRPSSPSPTRANLVQDAGAPLSPMVPPKPPSLSMANTGGSASSSSPRIPSAKITTPKHTGEHHQSRSPDTLPVTNSIFPSTLHEYLSGNDIKILLLDVRTREHFVKGHVNASAVVCLDPFVLQREGLTGELLEDSLTIAPRHEHTLFRNRDKFDLVVIYDEGSQTFGPPTSTLNSCVKVIFEQAFRRMLKKPPVLLVGGFKAWKSKYPSEVNVPNDLSEDLGAGLGLDGLKLSSMASSANTRGPLSNGHTGYDLTSDNGSPLETWSSSSPMTGSYGYHMTQIPEDESEARHTNGIASPTPAGSAPSTEPVRRLVRKPSLGRPSSSSSPRTNGRGLYDNTSYGLNGVQPMVSGGISYPQFPPTSNFSSSMSNVPNQAGVGSGMGVGGGMVSPPPQASINPSPVRRRSRSDYNYSDPSEQAISSFVSRPASIDYPDLSAQSVVRPPPAVATAPSERQDNRPRLASHSRTHSSSMVGVHGGFGYAPAPPTINSEYPVPYWPDMLIATSGLKNLGNTCYMNSTIQCLSATVPFSRFFTDGRWRSAVNMLNPLGSKGQLTAAFATILKDMWQQDLPSITPYTFRKSICIYARQFAGSEQHDSQEFLSFILDGLHEDLNRILQKPVIDSTPEREAELEVLPQQIASDLEWKIYRMRNDSIVVDFFQGQFRNRMECLSCKKTSTTYNAFMYLTLPLPTGRSHSKVSLQQCLDLFVQEEVMEKTDAWKCPSCKTLRKATKRLSISRLPPVLLIHLKRFTTKGHFTDKLETFVDFPLKSLDLTNYMPPPLPPNIDRKSSTPINLDDPRTQIPPYRYDLYGVTNHFGTLSSGHYTAFVHSRGNWLYCDDSRISTADPKEVVGKPAYVLYYKRVKS